VLPRLVHVGQASVVAIPQFKAFRGQTPRAPPATAPPTTRHAEAAECSAGGSLLVHPNLNLSRVPADASDADTAELERVNPALISGQRVPGVCAYLESW
jgi:hypothetical protein